MHRNNGLGIWKTINEMWGSAIERIDNKVGLSKALIVLLNVVVVIMIIFIGNFKNLLEWAGVLTGILTGIGIS